SDDKTVKVWDADSGEVLQTLEGHSSLVSSVAFSHDSKLLASASNDSTVRVWDAATGTLQQTLEFKGHISTLSFDISGSILITNIGCLKVNTTGSLTLPISSQEAGGKSEREGLGIRRHWVIWNDENLLWLPPGFRGHSSTAILNKTYLLLVSQAEKRFLFSQKESAVAAGGSGTGVKCDSTCQVTDATWNEATATPRKYEPKSTRFSDCHRDFLDVLHEHHGNVPNTHSTDNILEKNLADLAQIEAEDVVEIPELLVVLFDPLRIGNPVVLVRVVHVAGHRHVAALSAAGAQVVADVAHDNTNFAED
ncbi:hypothetical protein V493_00119, partial [Pseudogymnoascus sp. VKM F-4281 (FW-2241)]